MVYDWLIYDKLLLAATSETVFFRYTAQYTVTNGWTHMSASRVKANLYTALRDSSIKIMSLRLANIVSLEKS